MFIFLSDKNYNPISSASVNSNIIFEKVGAASCSVTTDKLFGIDWPVISCSPFLVAVQEIFDNVVHSLLYLSLWNVFTGACKCSNPKYVRLWFSFSKVDRFNTGDQNACNYVKNKKRIRLLNMFTMWSFNELWIWFFSWYICSIPDHFEFPSSNCQSISHKKNERCFKISYDSFYYWFDSLDNLWHNPRWSCHRRCKRYCCDIQLGPSLL